MKNILILWMFVLITMGGFHDADLGTGMAVSATHNLTETVFIEGSVEGVKEYSRIDVKVGWEI